MPVLERDDGARLHYQIADLTPPWVTAPDTVLFLHGIGSTGDIWWRWLPLLAERYRLVLPDARGLGRSTPPAGSFRPDLAQMTDDALAVARAAGADRFHLVGDSMGGTVAFHTAIHRPEAVRTLTVMSGPWRGGRIETAPEWQRHIEAHGMAGWSERMMAERFRPGSLAADEAAWIRRLQAEQRPDAIVAVTDMLRHSEVAADLPRIGCPARLYYPDDSPYVRPDALADLRACWPGVDLQVIADARHSIASTHAVELAGRLRAFLADEAAR